MVNLVYDDRYSRERACVHVAGSIHQRRGSRRPRAAAWSGSRGDRAGMPPRWRSRSDVDLHRTILRAADCGAGKTSAGSGRLLVAAARRKSLAQNDKRSCPAGRQNTSLMKGPLSHERRKEATFGQPPDTAGPDQPQDVASRAWPEGSWSRDTPTKNWKLIVGPNI